MVLCNGKHPQAACAFCISSFPCQTAHSLWRTPVCTWMGAAKYLKDTSLASIGQLHQISPHQWLFSGPSACYPISSYWSIGHTGHTGSLYWCSMRWERVSGWASPQTTYPVGPEASQRGRSWLRGQDRQSQNKQSFFIFCLNCKPYPSSQIAFELYCSLTCKSVVSEPK